MVKKLLYTCIICFITCMITYVPVQATENEEEYFRFVEDAFHAQVSLSEKERDLAEIKKILQPYLTGQLSNKFIKENVIKTDKGYQAFGSDFAPHYVPFFSYNEKTKVVKYGEDVYVFEYFGDKDGPVSYGDHYMGVKISEVNGSWKISEVLSEIPKSITERIEPHQINKELDTALKSLNTHFYSVRTPILMTMHFPHLF
ncbi:DUF3993 domain-containing protein [Lederbergia citrea]|uniref:DUF3993 domain-containing protein n=1 Tax=Lederbergia citrea TaxID=2833581 RepID=A0A942UHA6_9BACI|nr:DUF3993 domain-containing protein [Lederbergia citrea]MBS4177302.1 DUF3993 domain-containing protein [Lederbergia citrea]MBS4203965.1 DUF3993 domain-containing protein [Lederbergia citrea]MBS4221451.1 DUF3993 domain-containing protein [Lederbergia citrea]